MDDALLGAELEDIEATAVMEEPNDSAGEAEPEIAEEAAADSPEDSPEDPAEDEGAARGPGPGAELTDEQLEERALALLFASPDPLSVGRLVSLLERPPAARVRAAIEAIGHRLQSAGLPLQLRGIRGGYMVMTIPEMGEVVGRLARGPAIERISPAALETLSIVAYRQPVTKAEIEAIRGVQAGPILRSLVDRGLARVTGRADVPGHPLQYGTTKDFLDRFGLMGLDDLPRDAELARD
jgi:segregation and condensation protein B